MPPPKVKESYPILLSLVSRYFYRVELFHPACFEETTTSSHSSGRRVDKQTSRLPFDIGDDPVILKVDGSVVYNRVSRHLGKFGGKAFDENSRSAGIGFIATQGHKFLFCGCQAVRVAESQEAEALAISIAIDSASLLKEKYNYKSLVIVGDYADSVDYFMGKRKVPSALKGRFSEIKSKVRKSGLKFAAVHRYRELNRCGDRMACLGRRLQSKGIKCLKLWTESLPRGLKRCLEAELLPNTAERVLKEVSEGDEHVIYNRLKAVDTNALAILNLVAGACHAMSKGAAMEFTFLMRQDNLIIQKVSILMRYAMPGQVMYSSSENSWVFQNLDLFKEKFKQLRGQISVETYIDLHSNFSDFITPHYESVVVNEDEEEEVMAPYTVLTLGTVKCDNYSMKLIVTTYDGVLGTSYPKVDTLEDAEYIVQPQRKNKLKVVVLAVLYVYNLDKLDSLKR